MIEKKLANGETVKAYPISNSQKMMFLMSLKYGSGYPVNNIGCGYYWKGEMDIDIMKKSIYEAIERCDTMRLRFTMEKKLNLHQYVTEKSELIIEEWDYSQLTVEQAEPTILNEIIVEQDSDGITLSDNGNKQFFTFRFIEINQNHDESGSQ